MLAPQTREATVAHVREGYADFPLSLAREKLVEDDGLRVSKEMPRRGRIVGELVQIDGAKHERFDGRAGNCALIPFADRATSRLLVARWLGGSPA